MSGAFADQAPVSNVPRERNSRVYVAPAWDYLLSQWGNGTSQRGSLWGGNVGYSYIERDSIYFNGEFTYMAGMLRGSAGNDPTQEYITEIKLGYDLSSVFGDKFSLTPFLGFGSYVFNQSIGEGLHFRSHFWYVPIGAAFRYQWNRNWSIGFLGLGAPTFSGRWKIETSGNAPTTALWKAELPLIYSGALPFEWSLTPFVRGWGYIKHEELLAQKNTYYGITMTFAYGF